MKHVTSVRLSERSDSNRAKGRVNGTNVGWAGVIGPPSTGIDTIRPRLANPTDQVALEVTARRARQLVCLLVVSIVVVSLIASLLGVLTVSLPADDRAWTMSALVAVLAIGGLFVGLTHYVHGRCLNVLIQTAAELRQSASERAADLARTNAELRRRDRERAQLLATMSHELRTPLGSIVGFSRALLDEIDGALNAEQRADVSQVLQSGNTLLGVVNRTLDFARIDAGAVTANRDPVQVGSIVEEVEASLRPLAAARGLEVGSSVPPTLPPVEADEALLRQVLVNLLGNAVMFTDIGTVHLRAQADGERVTISVADTGIGIARADQSLIFEPFRQANPGSMRGSGGAGLGLAICQRPVQLMGGRIWVESEPGVGSAFFVSLPVAHIREVPVRSDRRANKGSDVVVVADAMRAGPLVASLRSRGLSAALLTGAEWQEQLAHADPRLVLFDALMPSADAWRRLAQLRSVSVHRERVVGLVGLVDGGGRIAVPADLDIVAEPDLEYTLAARTSALRPPPTRDPWQSNGRVVVVSQDLVFRHRLRVMLEAHGIRTAEEGSPADVAESVGRTPARALVVDLLVQDAAVCDLLSRVQADDNIRGLPILVVGPGAFSPSQQRDLRRDLVRWTRERPVPVSDLAGDVTRLVDVESRAAATA